MLYDSHEYTRLLQHAMRSGTASCKTVSSARYSTSQYCLMLGRQFRQRGHIADGTGTSWSLSPESLHFTLCPSSRIHSRPISSRSTPCNTDSCISPRSHTSARIPHTGTHMDSSFHSHPAEHAQRLARYWFSRDVGRRDRATSAKDFHVAACEEVREALLHTTICSIAIIVSNTTVRHAVLAT